MVTLGGHKWLVYTASTTWHIYKYCGSAENIYLSASLSYFFPAPSIKLSCSFNQVVLLLQSSCPAPYPTCLVILSLYISLFTKSLSYPSLPYPSLPYPSQNVGSTSVDAILLTEAELQTRWAVPGPTGMSQLRSGEPLFPGRKPKFGHHRWVISAISARDANARKVRNASLWSGPGCSPGGHWETFPTGEGPIATKCR